MQATYHQATASQTCLVPLHLLFPLLQWTGAHETDSRFDEFLSDPAFGVSQLHRSYKEAGEFLNFMRRRRGPMKKQQ